ncbi:nucleotidyltransferase domain-containing protein [Planctobacterium marinum]|uniref:Polymerase nucleotidyl transferase domain-containing protein n=1 Tax=Planctobacterium marinum TaxID=1631968 RepID=A0AA48HLW0_9ALTE|nr:hypothetical protein MACH26_03930 [Planctobacterium marinum]
MIQLTNSDIALPDSESALDSLQEIVERLASQTPVQCVIGYGSYFSGTAQPHSDVDVLLLSKSHAYEKHLIQRQRTFELVHIGIRRFRTMLQKGHVCYVPAMLEAKVLYDAPDLTTELLSLARARYQSGPAAQHDPGFATRLKSRINTLYQDMQDSLENAATFQLLHAQLISGFYTYLCAMNRAWGRSEKKMLQHIAEISPASEQLIMASLSKSATDEKLAHVSRLLKEHEVLMGNEVINYA